MNVFFLLSVLVALFSYNNPLDNLASKHFFPQQNSVVLATTDEAALYDEDNPAVPVVPYTDPTVAKQAYLAEETQTTTTATTLASTSKPNIVIIMLDDVNPIDGRFFTKTRTPAIYNHIVGKGINFTNFYTETTLCCPGRVGYLTGQHTQNHKTNDLDGTKFDPSESIATELSNKGYYTMLTGKYVNNYLEIPRSQAIPPGWSKFDAIYKNNGEYYNYNIISKGGGLTYYGNSPSDYSTDVISRITVKRLKEAPANKPIFAIINPYAIHAPHIQAPRHVGDSRCANIGTWRTPSVNEADVSDKAKFIRDLAQGGSGGYNLKTQCEMLLSVDDMVRKIRIELTNQGRLNNTLFILTADNGFSFREHRLPAKTVPYATHVPLYVAWPAGRGNAPKVVDTVLSNIDIAPTLCDLAGCVMGPYPNGQQSSDGISFLPFIKNQVVALGRDAILESQPIIPAGTAPSTRPAWWAIRTTTENPLGLWHYIEYATGEKELYDLSKGPCYRWSASKGGDPCELKNLLSPTVSASTGTTKIKTTLESRLGQLKKEKGYTPPVAN